jgi:hypothetical protein
MAGSGPLSVDDLWKEFREGTHIKFKIDLERGIFEADDEADHGRGMEAMERAVEARNAFQKQYPPASLKQVPVSLPPLGLTLEKAIQNYTKVEAPGLKADTWDDPQRALKSFVDKLGAQTLVGKIAQIYLRDIVQEGGICCINLTAESDGQSVKTERSKRLVPLHPDISSRVSLSMCRPLGMQGKKVCFLMRTQSGKRTKARSSLKVSLTTCDVLRWP